MGLKGKSSSPFPCPRDVEASRDDVEAVLLFGAVDLRVLKPPYRRS